MRQRQKQRERQRDTQKETKRDRDRDTGETETEQGPNVQRVGDKQTASPARVVSAAVSGLAWPAFTQRSLFAQI